MEKNALKVRICEAHAPNFAAGKLCCRRETIHLEAPNKVFVGRIAVDVTQESIDVKGQVVRKAEKIYHTVGSQTNATRETVNTANDMQSRRRK